MSTAKSIEEAMSKVSVVICAAGLIMAIAFGALMFSNILTVIQMGYLLMVSVLFDTFIARTFLVPPVVSLLRSANWWPHRFPSSEEQQRLVPDSTTIS
jgi:putative drug exporter of the RND superfamily